MDKETLQLKNALGSRGLKNTREREMILKELEVLKGHFNAEKLYSVLSRRGAKVSRPTIYRTLKLLEKYHLIDRLDIKQNCFYYESISQKKDHGHMICERCGRIVDFPSRSLEILKKEIDKERDFKTANISIQIFGLCKNCQNASENGALEIIGGQRWQREKN
jgi:Fur family ferric uptake transcriptional regulator